MFRSEDEDDYEMSDRDLNKLLIITQNTHAPTRAPKHEGYDRSGEVLSRVKISQDLEEAINIGLQQYEDGLWKEKVCIFKCQSIDSWWVSLYA